MPLSPAALTVVTFGWHSLLLLAALNVLKVATDLNPAHGLEYGMLAALYCVAFLFIVSPNDPERVRKALVPLISVACALFITAGAAGNLGAFLLVPENTLNEAQLYQVRLSPELLGFWCVVHMGVALNLCYLVKALDCMRLLVQSVLGTAAICGVTWLIYGLNWGGVSVMLPSYWDAWGWMRYGTDITPLAWLILLVTLAVSMNRAWLRLHPWCR